MIKAGATIPITLERYLRYRTVSIYVCVLYGRVPVERRNNLISTRPPRYRLLHMAHLDNFVVVTPLLLRNPGCSAIIYSREGVIILLVRVPSGSNPFDAVK